MLKVLKRIIGRITPLSENERRDRFLGQAKDIVHLEVLMRQWDRGVRY